MYDRIIPKNQALNNLMEESLTRNIELAIKIAGQDTDMMETVIEKANLDGENIIIFLKNLKKIK